MRYIMQKAFFHKIRQRIRQWFSLSASARPQIVSIKPIALASNQELAENSEGIKSNDLPYDENLLERAKTQWHFGDWKSLSSIEHENIQHHPDRAMLAVLAAAGRLQLGNAHVAHDFIQAAIDWGCSKRLIKQLLISGVYNSLGRAAMILGKENKALESFSQAIVICVPRGESHLISMARINEQKRQIIIDKE